MVYNYIYIASEFIILSYIVVSYMHWKLFQKALQV